MKEIIDEYYSGVKNLINNDLERTSPFLDLYSEFSKLFESLVHPYLEGCTEEEEDKFFDMLELKEKEVKEELLNKYGSKVTVYFGTF